MAYCTVKGEQRTAAGEARSEAFVHRVPFSAVQR